MCVLYMYLYTSLYVIIYTVYIYNYTCIYKYAYSIYNYIYKPLKNIHQDMVPILIITDKLCDSDTYHQEPSMLFSS